MTALVRRLASSETVSAVASGKKILGTGYFDALSQIPFNRRHAEAIAFCRNNIAHFNASKAGEGRTLTKTATSKIQKFILRAIAREMGSPP
jgi:hypothetical protein